MPIAEFRLPDGRIAQFKVPDGTTPEQAQQMIAPMLSGLPKPEEEPGILSQIVSLPKEVGKGFIRGLTVDPISGASSLAYTGAQAAGMEGKPFEETAFGKSLGKAQAALAPGQGTISEFGGGVGSMLSFLPGGLLKGGIGLATKLAQTGAVGSEEARQRADQARLQGIDVSAGDRLTAQLGGTAVGFTELAPLERIASPLRAVLRGIPASRADEIAPGLFNSAKRMLATGGVEGLQEGLSNVAQDLIAKGIYNPNLDVGQSALGDAAMGASVGAFAQGAIELLTKGKRTQMYNELKQGEQAKADEERMKGIQEVQEARNKATINPIGFFTAQDLSPDYVDAVNQSRLEQGKVKLNKFSIEDLVESGAHPEEINQLIAERTGFDGSAALTPDQVLAVAQEKNIQVDNKGFADFLRRTTGTEALETMSQPQLHAAFKSLEAAPAFEEPTALQEGSNSVRFTQQDYNSVIGAVKSVMPKEGMITLDQAMNAAAKVKTEEEAKALLKIAADSGDLNAVEKSRYDLVDAEGTVLRSYANRADAERAATQRGLGVQESTSINFAPTAEEVITKEDGTSIRKGTFKQPAGYEIRSDAAVLDVAPTAEEADAKADRMQELREKKAKQLQDQAIKLEEAIAKSNEKLEELKAEGKFESPLFKKAEQDIAKNNQKLQAQIARLNSQSMAFLAPLQVTPRLGRPFKQTGFTVFDQNGNPAATFKTIDEARKQAPTVGKPTVEFQAQADALIKQLRPVMDRLGLAPVRLNIEKAIKTPQGSADGYYLNNLIAIALDSPNPMRTLRHEGIHALKELGAFTPDQWRVLENKAKSEWMGKYDIRNRYKHLSEEEMLEEAISDAFSDFDQTKPPAGLIGALFNKIKLFLESLGNALRGRGFTTAEGLFERVEAGEMRPTAPTQGKQKLSLDLEAQARAQIPIGEFANITPPKSLVDLYRRVEEADMNASIGGYGGAKAAATKLGRRLNREMETFAKEVLGRDVTDEDISHLNIKLARINESKKYSLTTPEQPRIQSSGKIIGAPPGLNTEKDRTELVNRMTNILHNYFSLYNESKDWYENSGAAIREIARGDPELTERVIRLMALYSQANGVGANTTATIESIVQLAAGNQTAFAGRFPNVTATRIPAILAAPTMDSSLPGVDDKLMNFYRNLHDGTYQTDTFEDASTIDRWMMRLFGYPHAEDQDVGGATGVSNTQYIYAKDLIRRISEKNKKETGEDLKPRQIQAVLWTYVKNVTDYNTKANTEKKQIEFEPNIVDFSDYLVRATANITWESRPSTKLPIIPGIHQATRNEQESFNRAVRSIFIDPDTGEDKIFKLLGNPQLYSSQYSIGAYENLIAPNVITKLVLQKDDGEYLTSVADKYAAIIGYVTKQDAVPWYRADPMANSKDASKGYRVTATNVEATPEFEERLFKHLNKEMPGIGFTRVDDSFDFINFRDGSKFLEDGETPNPNYGKPFAMSDNQYINKLQNALKSFDDDVNFDVTDFRAKSGWISNDWTENKNGESYLKGFSPSELTNLRRDIEGWSKAYDRITDEYGKEYGWHSPEGKPTEAEAKQVTGGKASLRAPNTPEFKQWFGKSKIVGRDGKPKVMYHGTARDITEFEPKQANAIFLTDDPEFASGFSDMSENFMVKELANKIDESPTEKRNLLIPLIDEAIKLKELGTDKNSRGLYKATREDHIEKFLEQPLFRSMNSVGIGDALAIKIKEMLPSNANIVPVFVKAENPFDYANPRHIDRIKEWLPKDTPYEKIRRGSWTVIESGEVQNAIQQEGFDAFYVLEGGRKNLAVYKSNQIKSATGNQGTFDINNPDIRYSLSAPDTPEFKRWFGKSEAVDNNGKPAVLYHSTYSDFDVPTTNFGSDEYFKFGVHVGTLEAASNRLDMKAAEDYQQTRKVRDTGANIMPVFVKAERPLRLDENRSGRWGVYDIMRSIFEKAEKEGVDGISDEDIDNWYSDHFDIDDWVGLTPDFNDREYDPDKEERFWSDSESYLPGERSALLKAFIQQLGYDSIVYDNKFEGGGDSYLLLDANQIKSATGNQGTFDPNSPDIRYSMRDNIDPLTAAAIDRTTTVRPEKGFVERIIGAISPDSMAHFRQAYINKYEAIERQSGQIGKTFGSVELIADTSAIAAALHADRAAGIAAESFKRGVPVFRNGFTSVDDMKGQVKGLIPILEPLAKYKDPFVFRAFQFYAATKRGERLTAEGREKLFTKDEINRGKALAAQFREFEPVFKEYQKYNEGLVKYMKDTGVISDAEAKIWTQNWDYIPFYRQMDGETTAGPKVFSSIAGVGKPKALKGSEEALADFMETVVRNSRAAIESGMKNEAARRVIRDMLRLNQGRLVPAGTSGADIVTMKENGVTKHYQVDDPLLVESLKGLNLPQLPFLEVLAMPSNVLRNLVTKDPGFMIANLARDSMQAWVTSGTNITPLVDTFKQAGKVLAGMSPEAEALAKAGLFGGFDFANDIQSSSRAVEKELRKRSKDFKPQEIAMMPLSKMWELLDKGSTASDVATRAEVYKRVLKETGSEAEAIYQAMEVMNFSRKGNSALIRILTAVVPFLNARIQGLDVLYRSGFGKMATQNREAMQKAFITRSLVIFGLSCMYWVLASDTDEYKTAEQETRDNYWIFGNVRIPIPFEIGTLFKVFPERILEYFFGQDTGSDLKESIVRNITSTLAFNPIPQALLPIVENTANYSFFTGKPIVGMGLEGLEPKFQAGASTSILAQEIGKATNSSPAKIDNLIKGYTGTLGTYAAMMLDSVMRGEGDPTKASMKLEQMPVFKRFFSPSEGTGTISAYYDLKNAVETSTRTINFLERTGNTEDLQQYLTGKGGKLQAIKPYIQTLDKDMTMLRDTRKMVMMSQMEPDKKREVLDNIRSAEVGLTSRIQSVRKMLEN